MESSSHQLILINSSDDIIGRSLHYCYALHYRDHFLFNMLNILMMLSGSYVLMCHTFVKYFGNIIYMQINALFCMLF